MKGVSGLKKLFAVLAFAAVLSYTASGCAFGEGLFPSDEPEMENGYEAEAALSESTAFSQNPDEWIAVIVKQDSGQRVLIRIYGKARDGASPSDAFAGVSGIDSPRAWIGDAGGNSNDDGYVIIEGTAPSEADAKGARVNWIGYNENGRTFIQDFSGNPIMVNEISCEAAGTAKGGCDAGFGGLFSSFAIASLAALSCAGKKLSDRG
jgi:hypothetical protein